VTELSSEYGRVRVFRHYCTTVDFGTDSSSHFPFTAQTDRHTNNVTDATDRTIHATAWVTTLTLYVDVSDIFVRFGISLVAGAAIANDSFTSLRLN